MKAINILRSISFSMILTAAVSLVSVNSASAQTTLPEIKNAPIHGATETTPTSITQAASTVQHLPLILPITKEANNAVASGTVTMPEESTQVGSIAPTANYLQIVPTNAQSQTHQMLHVTVQEIQYAGGRMLLKGKVSGSGAE